VTKPPTRKDIADWCSKLYKELPDAMVRHKYYVVILGFMTKYKLEFDFFYFAILFFFRSGSLSLCCRLTFAMLNRAILFIYSLNFKFTGNTEQSPLVHAASQSVPG
jgi:hypothetical protein